MPRATIRSEEHTSELQSRLHLVCRLLLEKKMEKTNTTSATLHNNTPAPRDRRGRAAVPCAPRRAPPAVRERRQLSFVCAFFFNDTATTEIYTLSLHDALPIFPSAKQYRPVPCGSHMVGVQGIDRKSTRLNSSHGYISYAVFCLKKNRETA